MGKNYKIQLEVTDYYIKNSTSEKLLGVKIHKKLSFGEHVRNILKNANSKLKALARATPYMDIRKQKLLLNSFFNAHFNYCPLIWTLHSRCNNNKIKYFHGRCLRLIYNDKSSSYEELSQKDGSVPIHHKSIKELSIEMFKFKSNLVPKLVKDVSVESNENYNDLRNQIHTTHLPQHLLAISRRQLLLSQVPVNLVLRLFNLGNMKD